MVEGTSLDLAVVGGTVVTVDAAWRVLRGGAIGVRDGRIVAVEPDASRLPPARRTVDAAGHIVMPGLVDSHAHAGHALTKGLGEGRALEPWSATVGAHYYHASDPAWWEAESDLAALERLTFGVTTSLSMPGSSPRVDDPAYALAAASGYERLRLRHVVAAGPPNGPWPWTTTDRLGGTPREVTFGLDHALAVTGEIISEIQGRKGSRVRAFVGPSSLVPELDAGGAATDLAKAQLDGIRRLIEAHGVMFHAHAYAGQVRAAAEAASDLLGPRTMLAHCAGISMEEVEIMARTGTHASHGPLTHAYAGARFPVYEALVAGVNVAISTDGVAPDRSFDLLSQGRVAAQLQRVHFADTELLPAGKVLAMMTIDAARALGMGDEVGSLEAGKLADIVLVDARRPHLVPEILAPLRLVHHAAGQDVATVIVGGEVLMERGRVTIPGVDPDEIMRAADDAIMASLERAGMTDPNAQHPDTWTALRYG